MLKNTPTAFGWPAITLHWIMAVIIFGLFGMGLWMTKLDYYDSWYHRAPWLHQGIGMGFLALLAIRILWRWSNPVPRIDGARWERSVARFAHRLHYILMLAVGISGYLIPTAEGKGFDMPGGLHIPALVSLTPAQADLNGAVHRDTAWAIIILAIIHTAAALKHHFINRDNTLLRMLSSRPHNRLRNTPQGGNP